MADKAPHRPKVDKTIDVPQNPELVHVGSVAERTKVAQGGNEMSTVHHESNPRLGVDENASDGVVYVTRSVPDLVVQVNPGQHVKVPEGDDPGEPGDYYGDDPDNNTFVTHGPTAHMMEARGIVTILGVQA